MPRDLIPTIMNGRDLVPTNGCKGPPNLKQ
jgi:hypothetical protein